MKPTTVSLFCGAGGESAGKELAFKDLGIDTTDWLSHAINHWNLAVATHGANFPGIHVYQEDITKVTAATFGLEHIDFLWASPSCVHHSRARGGKPCEDQQRSHADEVVDRWLRVAVVDVLLIENVPEFAEWGPLDAKGQPIKARKGEFFRRFLAKLKALGYRYEHRILCAADYGDPTTRRRFFLQAVKDGPIVWPEPTHRDPRKGADMFTGHLPTWRTAAECIDWSLPCPSIFDRKKPLAEATLRRIAAGVVRYVLESKRPFLLNLSHGGRLEPLDEPFRTLTAGPKGGDRALVVPSLVGVGGRAGQSRPRGADEPFATATAKADTALVAASMISMRGTSPEQLLATAGSVEAPVPTISAGGGHAAVVAAFLAKHYGGPNGHQTPGSSVADPVGTITGQDHHGLVAASLVQMCYGERDGQAPRALDIEQPLGTVVAGGVKHGLASAFLTKFQENGCGTGLDEPMHTVMAGAPRFGMVAAFISHYYGQGTTAQDPGQPLHTITTLARHGLVTVEIDGETYVITDIGMRMLEPKELAKAMGFPDDFHFVGEGGAPLTKRDTVKMIGNACPVHTVAELIKAVVLQRPAAFGAPKESIA